MSFLSRFQLSQVVARRIRLAYSFLIAIVLTSSVVTVVHANALEQVAVTQATKSLSTYTATKSASNSLQVLRVKQKQAKQQGVNTLAVEMSIHTIAQEIAAGDFSNAEALSETSTIALNASLSDQQLIETNPAAKLGSVALTVTDGTTSLSGVAVSLQSSAQPLASCVTDNQGGCRFVEPAGAYQLQVSFTGYQTPAPLPVSILAQNSVSLTQALVKLPPVPTPTPTPSPSPHPVSTPTPKPVISSNSAPYSTYQHTTLGGFSADIMSFDLSSGHIRVMMDTANDTDCDNNCNVQSVASFVQQDQGFAGINGSYFCPTAYGSSCAGKTNSFYWKEYNSRVQRMINPTNTLGEQDPMFIFSPQGHATFVQHWVSYLSAGPLYAGFSCKPLLIMNGQNVLQDADMDSKEMTAKVGRAAIALKGQTLYSVVIQGATVPDLANALLSLGVDFAINSDAGGSSGMYFNGQYRLGPGRAVPNALVFAEQ